MGSLSNARVDTRRETEGALVDCPLIPGSRIRIASIGTPAFIAARRKALEPYRELIAADLLSEDGAERKFSDAMASEIKAQLFAAHIVRGWEGIDEPCTPEAVKQVMLDPEHRPLREWIEEQAGRWENFRAERKARSLGNS